MKRVLIVGSGGIGRRHLKGYSLTRRAQLAIVEPDAGRRDEAKQLFGITETYTDIGEADLGSFDLAVICAPAIRKVSRAPWSSEASVPSSVTSPPVMATAMA